MPSTSIVSNVSIPNNKKLKQAQEYLFKKHNLLATFNDLESVVLDTKKILTENDRSGLLHQILTMRAAMARVLWQNEIFIGVSVLDELVFQTVKDGSPTICSDVLNHLGRVQADRPGFVLYPLHEFGLEVPPLLRKQSNLKDIALFKKGDFAVCSQSNSFNGTCAKLDRMTRSLGIPGKIDKSDLRHHVDAGSMAWFESNPLMLVKIASQTGAYYENQFIYLLKLRIAASIVVMLHALDTEYADSIDRLQTSAAVNNFETLDIRHYLIAEAPIEGKNDITFRRVPMNVSALDLARLSDLAVALSTRTLSTARMRHFKNLVVPAAKIVEQGHFQHVNLWSGDDVRRRVFRRLVTALDWYRQSFGSRIRESEAIVSLAVAFETLLTDYYAPGVTERIIRRVGLCLRGMHGVSVYKAAVEAISHTRGEIVHTGQMTNQADIRRAQAAFARCFCMIANNVQVLSSGMAEPMRQIVGDT